MRYLIAATIRNSMLFLAGTAAATVLLQGHLVQAGEECQELVRNKCGSCHFVTYVCPKMAKGKGALYWSGVMKDMLKEGMAATDQEQERMVRCLADPNAKVKALCPAQ